ncbi:hypothetical protein CEXT_585191 [Caerostris extrusa]|uniref:Uncharacterized protein n=1 Tax=Caerostris extrusa TaxID=172846 RepID=A0AAV4QLT8_CAEEX|nr:hypothetical protein CEXT_585191 [Caerostris extrusa]
MLKDFFPQSRKRRFSTPSVGPHKPIPTWSSHLSPTPPFQFLSEKYRASANGFLWIQFLFRVLLPAIHQGVSFSDAQEFVMLLLSVIFLWPLQWCQVVCFACRSGLGKGRSGVTFDSICHYF